jgi:hypothetical protein
VFVRLHAVSPDCTHIGCIAWNTAPCHGSRFTPDGAVIQGLRRSLNAAEDPREALPNEPRRSTRLSRLRLREVQLPAA